MKRILPLILLVICLALALVSCGEETTTEPDVTTTKGLGIVETPADTTTAITPNTETPGVSTAPTDPDVEPIVTDDYTAIPNKFEWVSDDDVDYSQFDYSGTGAKVVSTLDGKYNGWSKTWNLIGADGSKSEIAKIDVRKLQTVGVNVTEDKTAKTAVFDFVEIVSKVEPAWKSVTARAGSYLMFEFTTNMSGSYYMTVTAKENGTKASAAYTQDGVTVTGANGKYTGIAKCTVPYQPGKTFYINICLDDGATYPIAATVPVTITTAKYDSDYRLQF
ncbi:MAG: hypothetical protein IJD35_00210, partial [Clostridia bacterium]|nr:hypothetical protein [Clostridia bacterium]